MRPTTKASFRLKSGLYSCAVYFCSWEIAFLPARNFQRVFAGGFPIRLLRLRPSGRATSRGRAAGQVRDYVAKRKLWACRLGALNSGNNRNKADFGINDSFHNLSNPRRIFASERSGHRRERNALYMLLTPTPRFSAVGGSPSVLENIPKLHFVKSQPQNCDSLKTISELKPIDLNSASLSATVFGYIQPRRAFALFMICSELKPFFAFISQ